jgi:septal ring-binding cell division protein DamX
VAPPKAAAAAPALVAPPKGRFTLQLSSFPDRSEADALARRFSAQGAYVVTSEIPGKGTWYRVRVGSYGSSQEAIAAKGSFEKQTNTIAYIAGR